MLKESISFLDKKLILFGGKGGVGKTTCAAATAIYLARINLDKKILVLSTDPAHSLSDSFSFSIGDEVTPIKGFDNLFGLEVSVKKTQEEFKIKHGVDIFELASRVPYIDREVISNLFSFSMPGMDEVMSMVKIIDLIKTHEYDQVVMDTAPTGHTLRLLELPDVMEHMLDFIEETQEMYRLNNSHFSRRKYINDEADKFIDGLRADVKILKSTLTDNEITEFVPITIPEAMGVYETEDLIEALDKYKIPVNTIIINGVNLPIECDFCASRKKEQQKYIGMIRQKFSRLNIIKVPLFPHEIRGTKLENFADILFGKTYEYKTNYVTPFEESNVTRSNISEILEKDLKIILFSGKGGVGKTTCSAATALSIARKRPDKKILIFSTDPAHSLSDSFGFEIGNKATSVKGFDNLYALEINPADVFNDFKKPFLEKIHAMIDTLELDGVDLSFERRLVSDFFTLSPLGLDELMAGTRILDFMEHNEYDIIILDTAPSGHTLRLLELPEIVIEWFDKIINYLHKFNDRVYVHNNIKELMKFLTEMKEKILNIQEIINDVNKTWFVIVTIPEAMGVLETKRLLNSLQNLHISSRHIITNKVIPATSCNFCMFKRNEQAKYIKKIKELFAGIDITLIPLLPHEVRGIDELLNFGEIMYGQS